ncbi:MAG TPA: tRNA preQ1(34) S-adenosylmethionine ribosyltransferase-isomerase QueA [Candidatus Kapabacteria bacterium]|jgi:S-adenosylmethionine:tRNA ribosyltransferase-isomerase
MSTRLSDYDYDLPDRLIAKYPPAERGDSRLLVIHRESQTWEDRRFGDLLEYLNAGDVLVLNNTKVIPARLHGTRARTGAKIEILLHQRIEGEEERWNVLAAPAKKAPVGERLAFDGLSCEVEADLGEGQKRVRFDKTGIDFWNAINQIGEVPLPPYLHREAEESDKERYQTVYASQAGAVAAPTAGLHFTPELLGQVRAKGVSIASLTLHTGIGTFRPVESEDITAHKMHEEFYELDDANAAIINSAKKSGARCIAVGTTTVRALETLGNADGSVKSASGKSGIFIYPPYRFKVPDAIVTNFHLPRSTLLMMISAFMGREFLLECYRHAVEQEYRFFSYGDAMLIG